jgi:hypothetical protein
MSVALLEPVELRARGFDALVKALGYVNAVRYIQQFERSSLDYTKERDTILPDWDLSEMIRRLAELDRT